MEHRELKQFVRSASGYYKYFAIKKRHGGLRRIMSPYSELRDVQTWIKENILDKIEQPIYVTAFAKGRTIMENARMHEGRNVLKAHVSLPPVALRAHLCPISHVPDGRSESSARSGMYRTAS